MMITGKVAGTRQNFMSPYVLSRVETVVMVGGKQ